MKRILCFIFVAAFFNSGTVHAAAVFLPEEHEIIRSCGLSAEYTPQAYISPHWLGGDYDADGSLDTAVPVVGHKDGRRGIALCRAGTWLEVIGFEEGPGTSLPEGYLNQLERWTVIPAASIKQIPERRPLPRDLTGDVLSLERVEKSRFFLYWNGRGWRVHEDYTYVEP